MTADISPSNCRTSVLRLGHRLVRDARITTHVGLVARAFGASELIVTGRDDEALDSLRRVSENWGGSFEVRYAPSWRGALRAWREKSAPRGVVAHLTMYGEGLDASLEALRAALLRAPEEGGKLLVVVGGEKVPGEIYSLSDYNVAVGSQPHSEVAALAVFLDRLYRGKDLNSTFSNAKAVAIRKGRSREVGVGEPSGGF